MMGSHQAFQLLYSSLLLLALVGYFKFVSEDES